MRRLIFLILLVSFGIANDASAQNLVQKRQNRIHLWGSWQITAESVDDDFYYFIETRREREGRNEVGEGDQFPPLIRRELDPYGWFIEFFDEGEHLYPGYVDVERIGDLAEVYEVRLEVTGTAPSGPYDDVVFRFEFLGFDFDPDIACVPVTSAGATHYECNGFAITQTSSALSQFHLPLGYEAVWSVGDTWYSNGIGQGSVDNIRQITQDGASELWITGDVAFWHVGGSRWFANCFRTGTVGTIVPLTDLVGPFEPWRFLDSFLVVNGRASWTYRHEDGSTLRGSATLPTCGNGWPAVDGSVTTVGGTVADRDSVAALLVPDTVLPAPTTFAIEVFAGLEPPAVDGFRSDARTSLVDIVLEPAPELLLADPGISLRLPLEQPLAPGLPLALFEVDPSTGLLTPKHGSDGHQIIGTIDPDGTTATFGGVVSFSLFVGLALDSNSAPIAAAGPDQTVECCGPVTLDGSMSSDPDGHALTYHWSGDLTDASGAVISINPTLGTHTYQLTVDDGHGGISTDTVTITVVDTIAPQITAPPNQTVPQSTPSGATVIYAAPTIVETGSGLAQSGCVPASGSSFAVGTTTVTCTAADVAGNTASATFNVTVTATPAAGNTAPKVRGLVDQRVRATSSAGTSVSFNVVGLDAEEGAIPAVCDHQSGDVFPVGLTTVTCTATDSSSLTSTGFFRVSVVANEPPKLRGLVDLIKEAAGASGREVDFQVTARDWEDGSLQVTCSIQSGALFAVGKTVVTCSAVDSHGARVSGSFVVKILPFGFSDG